MNAWPYVVASVAVVISAAALFAFVQTSSARRRLASLASERQADVAYGTCRACFPNLPEPRVRAAYEWVQQLLPLANVPIEATDRLWTTLHLDMGSVEEKFEASHEWRGPAEAGVVSQRSEPLEVVKDLMAEVLAHGYEGYIATPKRGAIASAA